MFCGEGVTESDDLTRTSRPDEDQGKGSFLVDQNIQRREQKDRGCKASTLIRIDRGRSHPGVPDTALAPSYLLATMNEWRGMPTPTRTISIPNTGNGLSDSTWPNPTVVLVMIVQKTPKPTKAIAWITLRALVGT